MKRLRISFFVHDLASNPVGRTAPLATALSQSYDVEIVGFLFSGDEVYAPYRDLFEYKSLSSSPALPHVLKSLPKLASMATGDVIVACKPLLTSLGPALIASGGNRKKPLLLDIEDDELVPQGRTARQIIWKDVIKGWRPAAAWKYCVALHPFTRMNSGVSVVSRKLQRRYGGVLVRHGPDARIFDPRLPELADRESCRQRFGLPLDRHLAFFAGTPRRHKDLATLVQALQRPDCHAWDLVLVGPCDAPDFVAAQSRLGARCHCLGLQPYASMAPLLAAVDAVPVLQSRDVFAEAQVPAKLLDAMAMAKPIIATEVGDLPEILGDGERGWLAPPHDPEAVANAFVAIAEGTAEACRRGEAARGWFLREASAAAIHTRMGDLIEHALERHHARYQREP